jgi:hypothetical protein
VLFHQDLFYVRLGHPDTSRDFDQRHAFSSKLENLLRVGFRPFFNASPRTTARTRWNPRSAHFNQHSPRRHTDSLRDRARGHASPGELQHLLDILFGPPLSATQILLVAAAPSDCSHDPNADERDQTTEGEAQIHATRLSKSTAIG